MAVTIIDRRTIVDEADTTTGWTNVGFGTTTSDIAEETAAVAEAINIGNQGMYFTFTPSVDLSNTLVYVYSFNNALQDAWDATIPPNGLFLGDGTNEIAFHQAGQNRRVFNHFDGPTNWQCLLLDGAQASTQNSAGLTFAEAGNFASLNLGAITQIGAYHKTNSKALGGGYNVACDIIRYGNDGIYVTGGGVGTEASASEIAAADRSTANQAAHGIFRELNPSSFGAQGPLTFGVASAPSASYFKDEGRSIIYEDRFVSDGKYFFNVEGNSGTTNLFELRNSTVGTAGPNLSISCSSDIDTLVFNGCSFINLRNTIHFPTDTISAATHSITNCSFTNQREIYPGTTNFTNNIISDYSGSLSGSVVITSNSNVSNWGDLTFNSLGTGHALYVESTGSYNLDNFKYSGYATTDGSTGNEVLYNNSGGPVTASVLNGGDTPTVRNGVGASTLVVNNISITLTGMKDNTEVRVFATGTTNELAGIETAVDGTTDDRSFTFSLAAGTVVDIVIHNLLYVYQRIVGFTIPATSQELPIQQQFDRNYLNP